MSITRRTALKRSAATFVAFSALGSAACGNARSANAALPLIPDPKGLLDLPEGFSYRLITQTGKPMSDGFVTPGRPDGMACFAHPSDAGKVVLVRNHEIFASIEEGAPFGENGALLPRVPTGKLYDPRRPEQPFFGGTSTLVVDLASGEVEHDHLSLIGTVGNCAGGATPWGSWLSCEEQMLKPGEEDAQKHHGFVFEVPSSARGLADPVPLKAMGRFAHEAASVDPETGVVYLTEDHFRGLFYRFLPDVPGDLAKGGKLQALAIREWDSADTRNWPLDWSRETARRVPVGMKFATRWIDMEDVESPNADLKDRGFAAGAAMFCRGEGMAYGTRGDGRAEHYFNCTQGGAERSGQVWSYAPGAGEGTADEQPGTLTLVYESTGADTLDLCDNLAISPYGDLILCEDGRGDNYLRVLTPEGAILDLARNAHDGAGRILRRMLLPRWQHNVRQCAGAGFYLCDNRAVEPVGVGANAGLANTAWPARASARLRGD